LLEDVVVEHVLGGLAKIEDPLAEVGRTRAVSHVLRVAGAGRMVVTADATDAAGDEMRVAGILSLPEDAVAAEAGERAESLVGLLDLLRVEGDLRGEAEGGDNGGDGIPGHLDQTAAGTGSGGVRGRNGRRHQVLLFFRRPATAGGWACADRWDPEDRRSLNRV